MHFMINILNIWDAYAETHLILFILQNKFNGMDRNVCAIVQLLWK